MKRSVEEVGSILSEQKEKYWKTLVFATLLAQEADLDDTGMIVVGGSAIEIYTKGGYLSGDIAILGDAKRLLPVLEQWRFTKTGRIWYRRDWNIAVDVMSKEYHGDWGHTNIYSSPYGSIRVAAIEDLLVSRLISAKYWQIPTDIEHAVLLAVDYDSIIDWEYVTERAKREEVDELLPELHRRVTVVRKRL